MTKNISISSWYPHQVATFTLSSHDCPFRPLHPHRVYPHSIWNTWLRIRNPKEDQILQMSVQDFHATYHVMNVWLRKKFDTNERWTNFHRKPGENSKPHNDTASYEINVVSLCITHRLKKRKKKSLRHLNSHSNEFAHLRTWPILYHLKLHIKLHRTSRPFSVIFLQSYMPKPKSFQSWHFFPPHIKRGFKYFVRV